jgi:cell division protein FtsQ
VAALERVDSVDVSRSWPHTLSIAVVERKAVLWATDGTQVRGIDHEGIDFRSYSSAPKSLVEAKISVEDVDDRLRVSRSLAEVVELIAKKDPALRKSIVSISAGTQDSIEIELSEGRTVVWGSRDNGERKVTVLKALLGIKATRYDVSAPDQPTTRE